MPKIKVLQISSRSDIGGGPKHLVDLCHGFLENDQNNIEIYTATPQDPPHFETLNNLSKFHFPLKSRSWSLKRTLGLLSFVRKNQIQLIHSHGRGAGVYSRILSAFGHPVVHTFHGVHPEKGVIGKIKWWLDKAISKLGNKLICVSSSEKEMAIQCELTTANDSSLTVIDNGINFKDFPDFIKTTNNQITFGVLARLTPIKGIDLLIKYFYHFSTKFPATPFQLFIAGDGEQKGDLQNLIDQYQLSDKVHLAGTEQHPRNFLKKLDIYISFSRGEGMPLSVLEAMASSLPCLLSNVPGHQSLNTSGNVLFSLEKSTELDKIIFELINDSNRRLDMGEKNKHTIHNYYSNNRMALDTYQLYLETLGIDK